jgi:hypothetical protein
VGYAADNANPASPGGELLAWVGSRLRGQGQRWDYRLLWSDWNQGAPGAIGEDPPVSTRSSLMDSTPKSRPSVARVGNQSAWVVVGQGSGESGSMELLRMQGGGGAPWLMVGKQPLPTSPALDFSADPCGFAWDAYPSVLHVVFSGRSRVHANTDIYYGHWQVEGVDKAQALTFRAVTGEAAESLTSRSFASRHIEWAVGNGSWPQIYVADPSGSPQAIYDPATSAPRFDSQTGRYVIANASFYPAGGAATVAGQVEFDASAGVVYFPQAPNPVSLDYRPYLLRLTTHLGRDATPSAFIETYRDLDENGQPRPAPFNPRLWLFWVRSGTAGLAPRLYFKTYRWVGDASVENTGWQEEIRANRDAAGNFYPLDVGEQAVPLNRTVNELGISAVKDPRYAQVWLAWSSTRGVPSSQLTDLMALTSGTVNADVYLEAFAPPLPD